MSNPIPGHISKQEFKEILKANKGYVSQDVTKGLKSAGMGRLLHESKVSEEQVVKAIKNLQAQGVLPKNKRPGQLYRAAGIRQRDSDEAARTETIKQNSRLIIKMEIEDEAAALEKGLDFLKHDERSLLGKSTYSRLQQEQQARDEKIRDQLNKKEKFDNRGGGAATKPTLQDMDIG